MGETLAFDAILSAQNFLSGINQMVAGIVHVEQSASSMSGGLATSLGGQKGKFASVGQEIGQTLTQSMGSQFGAAGNVATSLATALGPVGIAAGVAGAALIGAGVAAVQAAAQFETAMAGAKKVISLTPETDSGAYFQKLGQDIGVLSTTVPVAATELAGLAGVAGSLGVAQGSIMGFVESASQMSVAWEMPAEAAGTAAAKILNAFQQPINTANLQSLGNVINQIGDSMAATEPEVLDFTNRASFLNTTMGLSVAQVATLGGVLISAGLTAETAAGGMKSAMNSLTSETSKTGGMDNWAKLMGVSVDDLKSKVAGDLPNTLIETANKIAAITDPVERFQTAVALAGSEGAPAILKLAGATDTYNSALELTLGQWDKGQKGEKGGMATTFEANSQTFNAQMQLVSNAATFAGVAVGNLFLPALTSAAGGLAGFIGGAVQAGQALGGLISNSALFQAIGAAASSMGAVVQGVFSGIAGVVGPVWTALGGGSAAMGVLAAAFDLVTAPATALFGALNLILSGISSVQAATAPLGAAFGGALGEGISRVSSLLQAFGEVLAETVTKSDTFKTLVSVFESVSAGISSVIETIKSAVTGMIDWITDGISNLDVAGPVGTMLSGVTDALKDSPLGGVVGFLGDVANRADSIEGQKQAAAEAGNAAAEAEAKAIEENEKLKSAGEEAIKVGLGGDGAMDAAGDAGTKVAEEFSKEWIEEFRTQQADRDMAKILADSAAGVSSQDVDETLRTFDYLGEQFAVRIREHVGADVGDWFSYSLKAGDVTLGQESVNMGLADPVKLFEAATGLPAPEVGTAAYYYLMGNAIAAKKAELREQLKSPVEYDYSGIVEPLKTELMASGEDLGTSASKEMTDAFQAMLDAAKDPSAEGLQEFINSVGENIRLGNVLEADGLDDIRLYKEHLYSGISDMGPYLKELMNGLGEDSTSAFSDHFFSDSEKGSLLGMEPWLEYLKKKSPEEFAKAGGDSWLKFLAAIKAGASSAELEKMLGDLGAKSGKAFTDAITGATLGTGETKTLVDILAGDRSEITDLAMWRKNTFQPALQTDFDTIYKQAQSYYADDVELMKNWFDEKIAYAEKYSDDFEQWQLNILAMVKSNDLTEMQAAQLWSGAIKKSEEKMEKLAKDSGMFYGELVNNQAKWQDFINTEGGFVGPTAYYDKYREATDPNKLVSQKINEKYGITTTGSNSIDYTLKIDTKLADENLAGASKALDELAIKAAKPMVIDLNRSEFTQLDADIRKLMSDLVRPIKINIEFVDEDVKRIEDLDEHFASIWGQANKVLKVSEGDASTVREFDSSALVKMFDIQTDEAHRKVAEIDALAKAPQTKPLLIRDTEAIAAITRIDALASKSVYKTIYINEVSSGSSYSASAVQSGGYDWNQVTFPTLYAEGGYVDKPTLGIFGEAGGEFLVPEDDMASLISSLVTKANVSVGATIDESGISEQLSGAISRITVPPIKIPIEVDSSEIQEAVSRAFAIELSNARKRK